jgi:chromosomal replication initiation ATPase DnaA
MTVGMHGENRRGDTMTDAAGVIRPLDLGGQLVFLAGPPGSGKAHVLRAARAE